MNDFGLVGVASIGSAGVVGGGGVIRVYDLAIANTSAATATVNLYNGFDTTGTPYMLINTSVMYQHTDAGFRFDKGCFAVASGCTATINYIREF